MTCCWESTDSKLSGILYKTNIGENSRGLNHLRQKAIWVRITWVRISVISLYSMEHATRTMTCENDVPWLYGKPDRAVSLDDQTALHALGISLNTTNKKGDYYVHFNDCRWIVVERKDSPHRFFYAILQVKETVSQLREQGQRIDNVIVVTEKISKPESNAYGVDPATHEVYSKASPLRKRIPISGINLQYYTTQEVERLRRQNG